MRRAHVRACVRACRCVCMFILPIPTNQLYTHNDNAILIVQHFDNEEDQRASLHLRRIVQGY